MKLPSQIVGNIGLHYVCYRLSQRGWNVMPTARNARGIDVVAYDIDATGFIGIQVKALSARNPVPLGESLDRLMGDVWVGLTGVTTTPTAYLLRPDEVRHGAHRGERNGKVSFWLQPKQYEQEHYREAWGRLDELARR